jgi:hypothetical protein
MKFIKSYKIFEADANFMYDPSIENILPEYIKVIKGDPKNPLRLVYKKGISRHLGAEVQIPYETMEHSGGRENPDTLEFDIYWSFDTNTNSLNINVEVNYGDLTACQFSIEAPNKVDVIVYTSLHSKDDPSNTVFALDDESLESFCNYINRWDKSINIKREDLNFMDKYDTYLPT